jgi:hypothetical protein
VIPELVTVAGVWNVLPAGVHDATLAEIERRFAINPKRRILFDGFRRAVERLRKAGCNAIYLDGSFVTDKAEPSDFDVCWEPAGVDVQVLDPVFLDFSDRRRRQKEQFGGEFFPSGLRADGSSTYLEFFQLEKNTGMQKGIIKVQMA